MEMPERKTIVKVGFRAYLWLVEGCDPIRKRWPKTLWKCSCNRQQVVIALTGGEIVYFEMDPTGQLNEYTGQSISFSSSHIRVRWFENLKIQPVNFGSLFRANGWRCLNVSGHLKVVSRTKRIRFWNCCAWCWRSSSRWNPVSIFGCWFDWWNCFTELFHSIQPTVSNHEQCKHFQPSRR